MSRVGETKRVSLVLVLVSWQSLTTPTTTTGNDHDYDHDDDNDDDGDADPLERCRSFRTVADLAINTRRVLSHRYRFPTTKPRERVKYALQLAGV